MQLSPSVSIQTSTKHASQVLERRKKWVQEQQDLVQQQLDAMSARKDFAAREKADEGVWFWPTMYMSTVPVGMSCAAMKVLEEP